MESGLEDECDDEGIQREMRVLGEWSSAGLGEDETRPAGDWIRLEGT